MCAFEYKRKETSAIHYIELEEVLSQIMYCTTLRKCKFDVNTAGCFQIDVNLYNRMNR